MCFHHYTDIHSQRSHVLCHFFDAERVILSGVQGHGTQATPYTVARRNRPLLARRQRGIFRLNVGYANTQWISGILNPVSQGPG